MIYESLFGNIELKTRVVSRTIAVYGIRAINEFGASSDNKNKQILNIFFCSLFDTIYFIDFSK